MNMHKTASLLFMFSVIITLGACTDRPEETVVKAAPIHFDTSDECHVCGMIITNFPGPKGQVMTEKDQSILKFCSTRDMFSWLLQPENISRKHLAYVHNMAQTEWANPDDTQLINAREAFYVIGSKRSGAMGPTLASFATASEAEAFAREHGGNVLAFADITLDHLSNGMPMP